MPENRLHGSAAITHAGGRQRRVIGPSLPRRRNLRLILARVRGACLRDAAHGRGRRRKNGSEPSPGRSLTIWPGGEGLRAACIVLLMLRVRGQITRGLVRTLFLITRSVMGTMAGAEPVHSAERPRAEGEKRCHFALLGWPKRVQNSAVLNSLQAFELRQRSAADLILTTFAAVRNTRRRVGGSSFTTSV